MSHGTMVERPLIRSDEDMQIQEHMAIVCHPGILNERLFVHNTEIHLIEAQGFHQGAEAELLLPELPVGIALAERGVASGFVGDEPLKVCAVLRVDKHAGLHFPSRDRWIPVLGIH